MSNWKPLWGRAKNTELQNFTTFSKSASLSPISTWQRFRGVEIMPSPPPQPPRIFFCVKVGLGWKSESCEAESWRLGNDTTSPATDAFVIYSFCLPSFVRRRFLISGFLCAAIWCRNRDTQWEKFVWIINDLSAKFHCLYWSLVQQRSSLFNRRNKTENKQRYFLSLSIWQSEKIVWHKSYGYNILQMIIVNISAVHLAAEEMTVFVIKNE